jgi:AcrR family transcriptional regulator
VSSTQQLRRAEQRDQARRAILDATEELLLEEGYEGFSMRRLVARCGYTAPTIYHHFGDKEGLLDQLVEQRFGKLARQLRRVPQSDDPVDTIRATFKAFVRFGLRNPTHYRLLSVPRAEDHAPPRSAEESREALEKAWMQLWQQGRLRAGDAKSAGQALWALAHGIIVGRIQRPDHDWSKTLIDDAVDALLRGLVASPSEGGALRNEREK